MHDYAQTFPQLLNQLLPLYSREDLRRVATAYQGSIRLFSGAFRASGKTFIAHVVGTASIVARHGGNADLVITALLHAAYTHGDHGWRWSGDPRNRRSLIELTGEGVEALIHAYAALRWNRESIRKLAESDPLPTGTARDVLFVRLCNELEEHLDLGLVYCGEAKQGESVPRYEAILTLCRRIGNEALADELATAFERNLSAEVPAELCNPTAQPATAFLPSASYQPLWKVRVVRLIRKLRKALHRQAGPRG
jgi:hypothetical protein